MAAAKKRILLDAIYWYLESAQLCKKVGGHYECTYETASRFLDCILGEADLEKHTYSFVRDFYFKRNKR